MSKILVTGGAGFIGSNLVDQLIKQGHRVVVIDNLSTGKRSYLNPRAKFYKIDICSPKIAQIFKQEKFKYVFHLAAQIDVRISVADPARDTNINVIGSINIFDCSYRSKVKKVIFASTGGALYGDTREPAKETTPVNLYSAYSINKYAVEQYLKMYSRLYGLNYTVLRPANIYGPRQFKGGEGAVIAVFTYNALKDKTSIIYGDGRQTRDFVYVGDIVRAFILAINRGNREILNIGSGREVKIIDLTRIISKIINKRFKYQFAKERAGEVRRSVLNSVKAKKVIGWQPRVKLADGIIKTLDWVKKE